MLKLWANTLALTVLVAGCSLVLDSDKPQCNDVKDCNKLEPGIPFTCTDHLCIQEEGGECLASKECPGYSDGDALCDLDTKKCVTAPACQNNDDCEKYESAAEPYICIQKACEPPQCVVKADCPSEDGADLECEKGLCVDLKWGCLNDQDTRPGVDGKASYRVQILTVNVAGMQTPVTNLQVRLCLPADPTCSVDAGPNYTYDDEGWLEFRDLRNSRYILKLAGETEDGTALLSGTSVTYRPVIGNVVEPYPLLMFTETTRGAFGPFLEGVETDWPNTGLLIARVYDCDDKSADGVVFNVNPATPCGTGEPCTTSFYFDESNLPHTDWTSTDSYGVGGILNMIPITNNELSFRRLIDDEPYATFGVSPVANEVTYMSVYPGKF